MTTKQHLKPISFPFLHTDLTLVLLCATTHLVPRVEHAPLFHYTADSLHLLQSLKSQTTPLGPEAYSNNTPTGVHHLTLLH